MLTFRNAAGVLAAILLAGALVATDTKLLWVAFAVVALIWISILWMQHLLKLPQQHILSIPPSAAQNNAPTARKIRSEPAIPPPSERTLSRLAAFVAEVPPMMNERVTSDEEARDLQVRYHDWIDRVEAFIRENVSRAEAPLFRAIATTTAKSWDHDFDQRHNDLHRDLELYDQRLRALIKRIQAGDLRPESTRVTDGRVVAWLRVVVDIEARKYSVVGEHNLKHAYTRRINPLFNLLAPNLEIVCYFNAPSPDLKARITTDSPSGHAYVVVYQDEICVRVQPLSHLHIFGGNASHEVKIELLEESGE